MPATAEASVKRNGGGLLAGLGAQRLRQPAILRWAGAATLLAAFVLAVR